MLRRAAWLACCVVLVACSREPAAAGAAPDSSSPPPGTPADSSAARPDDAPSGQAAFINKVWQVQDSTGVVPGTLYAYLSEGSLLITSPNSRPALGSWKYQGGRLTMVEEGIDYPVDVLELTDEVFRIRVHSPGDPLDITFVPAPSPPPGRSPDRRY